MHPSNGKKEAARPAPRSGPAKGGVWGCLVAILRQRCPRCRTGRMFRGLFEMNDPCPVCGLPFQREEGYFLGAMYFSYALASAFLIASYFITAALLPDWDTRLIPLVATLPFLPLVPLIVRYSRVLWIYFDRGVARRSLPIGAYEKSRLEGPPGRDTGRGSKHWGDARD
jgi:uncharacterized protein (DUF983 family)